MSNDCYPIGGKSCWIYTTLAAIVELGLVTVSSLVTVRCTSHSARSRGSQRFVLLSVKKLVPLCSELRHSFLREISA